MKRPNTIKAFSIILALIMIFSPIQNYTILAQDSLENNSKDITTAAVSLNKTTATIYRGNSTTLKLLNCKKKIKWYSTNTEIATVSSKGKVTGKKKGKATIVAKVGSKKYKCKLTVKGLSKMSYTMTFDKPVQLSWDTLKAKINTEKFEYFYGSVTAKFTFEKSVTASGATPEIYLRTGWNNSDIIGSKHFVKKADTTTLTVKYTSKQMKKIKAANYLYVYGCNLKIKSVKFSGYKLHYNYKYSSSPVAKNGKLSVSGTKIVNSEGKTITLQGASVSGITWYPKMVRRTNFKILRDDWKMNLIRMAMYTDTSMYGGASDQGYASASSLEKASIYDLMCCGIDEATALGMYVMVDWHVLDDKDPNKHIDEAKKFFSSISEKYKDNKNIIYEICNEPNGSEVTWSKIKKYAQTIIPIIRANDPNAIIIVGTPSWSANLKSPAADPITDYDNIMYSYHFYAATHKSDKRADVENAVKSGLPVFVSEYGFTEASGSGSIDYTEGDKWFSLMKKYNIACSLWNLNKKSNITGDKMSKYNKHMKKLYNR